MAPKEGWTPEESQKLLMVFLESKSPDVKMESWNLTSSRLDQVFDGNVNARAAKTQWTKLKKQWTEFTDGLQATASRDFSAGTNTAIEATGGKRKAKGGKPASKKSKVTKTSASVDLAATPKDEDNDEDAEAPANDDDDDFNLNLLNSDTEDNYQTKQDGTDPKASAKPKPKPKPKPRANSKGKATSQDRDEGKGKGKANARSTTRCKKRVTKSHQPINDHDDSDADDNTDNSLLADGTPKTAINDLDTFMSS